MFLCTVNTDIDEKMDKTDNEQCLHGDNISHIYTSNGVNTHVIQ
jgi:hypothetical protein